jgi:hypothetical protein
MRRDARAAERCVDRGADSATTWRITDDFLAGILTGSIPKSVPAPSGFQENPNVFAGCPGEDHDL